MGKIIIQEHTTKYPLQLIGEEAGICWGADTSNIKKNIERAKECLSNNHGRTLEFPQVYFILENYSARVIREFYTHIGGSPTRLQASTRYINYGDFDYIIPPKINDNNDAKEIYERLMLYISENFKDLRALGIPLEDIANILPLGMVTKAVVRTNCRHLIDMSHQRYCKRAYWEFQDIMENLGNELSNYSNEWKYIVDNYFKPKCSILGYCPEKYSCKKI